MSELPSAAILHDNSMHNSDRAILQAGDDQHMMAVGDGPDQNLSAARHKDNAPTCTMSVFSDVGRYRRVLQPDLGTKLAPQEKQDLVACLRAL